MERMTNRQVDAVRAAVQILIDNGIGGRTLSTRGLRIVKMKLTARRQRRYRQAVHAGHQCERCPRRTEINPATGRPFVQCVACRRHSAAYVAAKRRELARLAPGAGVGLWRRS